MLTTRRLFGTSSFLFRTRQSTVFLFHTSKTKITWSPSRRILRNCFVVVLFHLSSLFFSHYTSSAPSISVYRYVLSSLFLLAFPSSRYNACCHDTSYLFIYMPIISHLVVIRRCVSAAIVCPVQLLIASSKCPRLYSIIELFPLFFFFCSSPLCVRLGCCRVKSGFSKLKPASFFFFFYASLRRTMICFKCNDFNYNTCLPYRVIYIQTDDTLPSSCVVVHNAFFGLPGVLLL